MSDALEDLLTELEAGKERPLYLFWGEEYLVRQAAETLLARLLPDSARGLNQIVLDGASPREIAEELATLPMFPGRKVVFVRDPEFLAPRKGRGDPLAKARDAWRAGKRKEGARRVLAVAAKAGWTAADLDPSRKKSPSVERWRDELGVELAEADLSFLKEVAAFCQEERISAPEGDDSALIALLKKKAQPGQVLVIAATDVDPKSALIKIAKDRGALVERRVASKLKDLDLSSVTTQALAPHGKRLAPAAATMLKDRCGGNMRLIQSELEKLALHATGAVIEARDVDLLVHRAREEEFLELSDAIQKRDLKAATAYVEEAIGKGAAPLALLGAITSVVRTLLSNHERLTLLSAGKPPRSFDDFQARVFPQVEAEAKAAGVRVPHPYASFMGMQAATRFTRAELLGALSACAESDLALKLGGGRLVVERLLWTVCGKMPPWDSGLTAVRRDLERT